MKDVFLVVIGPGGNERREKIAEDASVNDVVYILNANDIASGRSALDDTKVILSFLTEDGKRAAVTLLDNTSYKKSEHCRFAPGCYITMQSMEHGVNLTAMYHEFMLHCETTGEQKPTTGDFVKDWLTTRAS